MSIWISSWGSARLYTRTSSMRPENHSLQTELPPIRRFPSETSIESDSGTLATASPLT